MSTTRIGSSVIRLVDIIDIIFIIDYIEFYTRCHSMLHGLHAQITDDRNAQVTKVCQIRCLWYDMLQFGAKYVVIM